MLLTPAGTGAIAVVRISGPGVAGFLTRRFSKPVKLQRCVHGELRGQRGLIDDPIVVLCQPDVADISLHGGRWIVRSVLELAAADGFEFVDAAPMPLPRQAVDGRDTIWTEVEQYLPWARTEIAVRMLLAQPTAWADLPESRREIAAILRDQTLVRMVWLPRVAIIGEANVGKSTLANQLFAQERSITADVPGTTRDWVAEIANIDGLAVQLIDTPGRRPTADPIERAAINASEPQIAAADLVLIVMDRSTPQSPQSRAMLEEYPDAIVVANFSDRPAAWEIKDAISTVARSGLGVDRLRAEIRRRLGCENLEVNQPRCWTQRQRAFLEHRLNA